MIAALVRLGAAIVEAGVASLEALAEALEEFASARARSTRSRYWIGFSDGVEFAESGGREPN